MSGKKRGSTDTNEVREPHLMHPESAAETNQEGLPYGFAIKRDGLEPKERKEQQEIISDGHIIYQSDGNSETVDHVEARDQPKSFRTTILQFRSSQDIYDFGQFKVFDQVFLVFISCQFLCLASLFVCVAYYIKTI
ncbi:hypothetical protein YC2023_120289 [Brassica napus]